MSLELCPGNTKIFKIQYISNQYLVLNGKNIWVDTLPKKDTRMAYKHIKRYTKMEGKTCSTGTTDHINCWGCGETGTLTHWWQKSKIVQPLWKQSFKKLNIHLACNSTISLLYIYSKMKAIVFSGLVIWCSLWLYLH
jgi:hypothetical protein